MCHLPVVLTMIRGEQSIVNAISDLFQRPCYGFAEALLIQKLLYKLGTRYEVPFAAKEGELVDRSLWFVRETLQESESSNLPYLSARCMRDCMEFLAMKKAVLVLSSTVVAWSRSWLVV